ncbi:hypothetical protein DL93DRAFT_2082351 [Clavulina sp. PMI_390]|nr:hypothetical protein DL93DRAFT_2082351 [Clavulina sp. PMI_390]
MKQDEVYDRLVDRISFHHRNMPTLPDPKGLQPIEAAASLNSNILILVAHATLYGSGIIVYSLRAGTDPEARGRMLQCVEALVDASEKVQAHRRIHPARVGLLSMVHMMNAVRIIIHELQIGNTHHDPNLSLHYCDAIEVLLDYVDNTISLYPAWADAPLPLRNRLITATVRCQQKKPGQSV